MRLRSFAASKVWSVGADYPPAPRFGLFPLAGTCADEDRLIGQIEQRRIGETVAHKAELCVFQLVILLRRPCPDPRQLGLAITIAAHDGAAIPARADHGVDIEMLGEGRRVKFERRGRNGDARALPAVTLPRMCSSAAMVRATSGLVALRFELWRW